MSGIIDGISRIENVTNLRISDVTKEETEMLFHYLKHVDVINGEEQPGYIRKRMVTTISPSKRYLFFLDLVNRGGASFLRNEVHGLVFWILGN